MFKNITLSVLCVLCFGFSAKSQATYDEDTLIATGYVAPTSSDYAELIANTKIRNNTNTPDTIVWQRIVENLPSMNWTSAVCDITQCYGVTTNTAQFILGANVVKELSFHFYPKTDKGKGYMVVRFSKKSNPSIYTDIYINAQGYGANINTLSKVAFSLFPNPTNTSLIINSYIANNGQFSIVNLFGETVLNGSFQNGSPIDISPLSKGIYCVNVIGNNSVTSSKLVVE